MAPASGHTSHRAKAKARMPKVVTEIRKRRSVTASTKRSVLEREGGDTCVFPHCHHVTILRVRSTNCFCRAPLGAVAPPPESIYFSFVNITCLSGDNGDNKRNCWTVTTSGQKRHPCDNKQISKCHHLHAFFEVVTDRPNGRKYSFDR